MLLTKQDKVSTIVRYKFKIPSLEARLLSKIVWKYSIFSSPEPKAHKVSL